MSATGSDPFELVLSRLECVTRTGSQYAARCPAHDDKHPSLHVARGDDGRVLINCKAGCDAEEIVSELGLSMADLFERRSRRVTGKLNRKKNKPSSIPSGKTATVQHPGEVPGCTLAQYSEAKGIPVKFLLRLGLRDCKYQNEPAVRIPHYDADGQEIGICFRTALHKPTDGADNRLKWKAGTRKVLYGLDRLDKARAAGYITLVEGQSDCHTLWLHEEPALGLPGANSWHAEWDAYLDNVPTINVVIEPDKGGETVRKWLSTSSLRDRVRLIELGEAKDPSGLCLSVQEGFRGAWKAALEQAVPWVDLVQAESEEKAKAAWATCQDLAKRPDILSHFAETLERRGVAGESRTAKLIYLGVTSRLLQRPVSIAVKGPSSAGKSYTVDQTLDFFPASAYYALSAMSERALAYSEEPLQHRILVIYEAAGMSGDFASYLMRSLLSEGLLRYETVEKTGNGLRPRLIQREGPTGLLVTTTAVHLHPENETRLLSLLVTDTPAQTQEVLKALANENRDTSGIELTEWHALQEWLENADRQVTIPYAAALSEIVPPVATRLRRDFGMVLNLIRTHALLHQATRDRDTAGRIVATIDDYRAIQELVADYLAEGVGATVPETVRATVKAVADLLESTGAESVSISQLASRLKLDKGTVSRRVSVCLKHEYLRNLETGKGNPYKLKLADALPEEQEILPSADKLAKRCSVAVLQGGIEEGLSLDDEEADCTEHDCSNGPAFDPCEYVDVTHERALTAGVYRSTLNGTYRKRG